MPTNGGSVNAVARKARVRGRPDAIIRALATAAETDRPPPEIRLDTLQLDGETEDGAPFIGCASGWPPAVSETGSTKCITNSPIMSAGPSSG